MTCSSDESTASESRALVLSTERFVGVSQGSSTEARVVNHRSSPPRLPGRSEVKSIVNSRRARSAYVSLESLFTGGATLCATDQSPYISMSCDEKPGLARYHASRQTVRDRLMIPPLNN